eukprot:TRINITY_DN105305_c0_g1_i1.p1 TRINITY_DN105305_c0_g1~~TRINITY_DN105305_c0_g1_i1.p1  ORF type:complete len:325 (-),score=46.52 TRINITY_DN105305_c0_g1_i1:209-1183(-)
MDDAYTSLERAVNTFLHEIAEISAGLQNKWELLKQQRELHKEAQDKRVQRCAEARLTKVKLNIGGTMFSTTEATLLSEPDSFFWTMLHSGQWKPDDDGEFFIDRAPNVFGLILDYLRTRQPLDVEHLPTFEQRMLQSDIDFYQISSVPPFVINTGVKFLLPADDDSVVLMDNDHTLLRKKMALVKNTGWGQYYVASFPMQGIFKDPIRWKLTARRTTKTITKTGWNCWTGIGDLDDPQDENVVDIGLGSGEVDVLGGGGVPFVEWPEDLLCRVVEFEYAPMDATISISALGKCCKHHLPPSTTGNPGPVVLCNRATCDISFTIE